MKRSDRNLFLSRVFVLLSKKSQSSQKSALGLRKKYLDDPVFLRFAKGWDINHCPSDGLSGAGEVCVTVSHKLGEVVHLQPVAGQFLADQRNDFDFRKEIYNR